MVSINVTVIFLSGLTIICVYLHNHSHIIIVCIVSVILCLTTLLLSALVEPLCQNFYLGIVLHQLNLQSLI
jgi:hypothetical protein